MKPFTLSRVCRTLAVLSVAATFWGFSLLQAQSDLQPDLKPDRALISTGNLKPIFNQTNLDGWVIRGGKASYKIEDGVIVGSVTTKGGGNTFLCTEKEYGDFILELDIKADKELNSGVQIRSQYFEQPTTYDFGSEGIKVPAKRIHGYQVEVDNRPERRWSGGIYEEACRGWLNPLPTNSPAGNAFQFGAWNQYRIECRGASLRTWVNGVPAADLVDAETLKGFIGLQVHSTDQPGLQVRFRNVRLRDLGASQWTTAWDCRSIDGLDQSGLAQWLLEDGILHAIQSDKAEQPGTLTGRTPLMDFTVRMKYKIQRGGFELAFRPTNGSATAGALSFPFNNSIAAKIVRNGDWNTITATVHGQRVVVSLNGHQLQDAAGAVASGGVLPGLVLPAGQAADVVFKDFEILSKVE
jgi:hypothetical protein